jgi:hypothetical protein
VLSRLALAQVDATIAAARAGWTTARVELREVLDPAAVDAVISLYEREGARLAALQREVRLVATALEEQARRERRA